MNNSKLFCFGFGYSAAALARRLGPAWRIAATCREEAKRAGLAAQGIEAWIFDGKTPLADPAKALAGTTHLLSSVPPDGPDYNFWQPGQPRSFLLRLNFTF